MGELLEENTMTMTKRVGVLAAVAMIAAWQTGCIAGATAEGSWGMGLGGSWQTATSELTIETDGVSGLNVRTHNGKVSYAGGTAGAISVTAKKRGRGLTLGDAQAALDAIDVYVEDAGDGRKKLAWRWNTPKHWTWSGGVSFTINGPASLDLDVETRNGSVQVEGVEGDVRAVTRNGSVVASSSSGSLVVVTRNGRIEADYAGPSISLTTRNGGIKADLSDCGAVAGDITTRNGSVRVIVGAATDADIDCVTHNGGIQADGGINVRKVSRKRLEGTVGGGGTPLTVRTRNGGIRLTTAG